MIIEKIVHQHAEEAATLHSIRTTLAKGSHAKLKHIRRFDDRVAAHLDGLLVAGEYAWPLLDAALVPPSPGALSAATVMAIETKSADRLNRLYAVSSGSNFSVEVGADEAREVTGGRATDIGKDDALKIGKNLIIDAGESITIKTGKASISMNKDGTIHIKGKDITFDGSGKIHHKAASDIIMKGSKITQN